MKDLLAPNTYRNKKILNAAKDCPHCMHCGKPNDGTIVAAHYQGFRQHALGKGVATKPSDAATAFVCDECHNRFDGRLVGRCVSDIEHSEQFLFAIVKTHIWLLSEGVIK